MHQISVLSGRRWVGRACTQALRELLQEQGDESVAGVLPQWAHVFPRLVLDNDRGVRQAASDLMHLLAQVPPSICWNHPSFGSSTCTALDHRAQTDAGVSFPEGGVCCGLHRGCVPCFWAFQV